MGIWTSLWIFLGYLFGQSFFEYELYVMIPFILAFIFIAFLFYIKMMKHLKKEVI
ncbi:MAG: hypothetical protein ABH811_00390 [archaeon]